VLDGVWRIDISAYHSLGLFLLGAHVKIKRCVEVLPIGHTFADLFTFHAKSLAVVGATKS
jgi:hypothetical protein